MVQQNYFQIGIQQNFRSLSKIVLSFIFGAKWWFNRFRK